MIKPILMTAGLLTSTLALAAQNYVVDPQLTDYRGNQGESNVWVIHEDSDGGLGEVGSSGDTAFDAQGSSRFRFKKKVAVHDFTATPGLSQVVNGLPVNTDMTYSFYYCDKKGEASPSWIYYGVREVANTPLSGKVISEARAHVKQLDGAPKGDKKDCFRQVSLDFNSGASGSVEIFSLMELQFDAGTKPDLKKDAEIRVDEFAVTVK